jgi:transcriptional regulator with XRE-family HTH domain
MITVGDHIREWRLRRRMSQLDLAVDAEISPRHLSFLETGRSRPSREMILRLAEQLDIPLRERNVLLVAAGYAPVYSERRLDDPALATARQAVDKVIRGHEPFPAIAIDRHWTLVSANRGVPPLLAGVDPLLLQPPVNVLRLGLHPKGLAPSVINLGEWRAHLLARLRREIELTADPTLETLFQEALAWPLPAEARRPHAVHSDAVAIPLRLRTAMGELSFISTITVFGTPADITLAELALETFFPTDDATADAMRRMVREAARA